MQGSRGSRGSRDPFFDFGDPFAGFGRLGGFGGHRSLTSGFFGGRDPFDDPFFTRPFGGMFESSIFGPAGSPFMDSQASGFLEHQVSQPNISSGPIIEELNSDDEKEEGSEEKKDNPRKHGRSSKEPYVEDPDDEAELRKNEQMQYRNDFSRLNGSQSQPQPHPQARSFAFQSSTVTYGGTNGPYYTSSKTRRTGSDGLTIEESKEADSVTGQATHRIARGLHEKGHSVTRKLNSDGRVDTMQTLHNLDEDELSDFEEAWKGNARKHLPGWIEGFNVHGGGSGTGSFSGPASRGGWALPSSQHHSGDMSQDTEDRAGSSRSQYSGRMKAGTGDGAGGSRSRVVGPGVD